MIETADIAMVTAAPRNRSIAMDAVSIG